jgi:hypothetical protein
MLHYIRIIIGYVTNMPEYQQDQHYQLENQISLSYFYKVVKFEIYNSVGHNRYISIIELIEIIALYNRMIIRIVRL